MNDPLARLVKRLPKVDLHFHGEGALKVEQFITLADKHRIPLPSREPEAIRREVQVSRRDATLLDFIKKFRYIGRFFPTEEAVTDFLYEAIKNASEDQVRYLELRFAPHYVAEEAGLPLPGVMEGALEARRRATIDFPGTVVNFLAIAVRDLGPGKAEELVDLALRYRGDGVVGVDLAADEVHYPPELFRRPFQRARGEGLRVTMHAGEARGAESVRTAILECGAERIGHGVRAVEDPAVERLVIERRIPMETCLTSNLWLGAVPPGTPHPLRSLFEKRAHVTINTDDPGIFGIDLSHECLKAIREHRFTLAELRELLLLANAASFRPEGEKAEAARTLAAEFDQVVMEWRRESEGSGEGNQ